MDHLYPTKDALVKELSTITELTVHNLCNRVSKPKKEVVFVLNYYNELFKKTYRNPINVKGNKRPIWSLKK